MSFYQRAKRSLRTYIRSNWNVYNRHCIRSQHWLIERVYCYCMITRGRMLRGLPGIRYSDSVGSLCVILLTHLTLHHQIPPLPFLDNHLRGKSFTNEAEVRKALVDFFVSHTPEFNRKGIEQLETRWQKGLDADGDYFEDLQCATLFVCQVHLGY
ncbi:histone-lysine N-methyltransferase SETMAR [Trichonephila inaurata madagascariensis]|uniref:Histone-lysine N-methyltransferase SETMAR n=1 Tax=Trichonephila inaurata madagascariensis TaxID=2747483 RepID=A0A8X7CJ62_9ARAC|nr:histone-lysine N-methyltransferase SETMAR [Trichonephila inaurata madagascariensis]